MTLPSDKVVELAITEAIKPMRKAGEFAATAVPFTPVPLIREIFSKIPVIAERRLGAKIAVLFTVEMALQLKMWGFTNVTLITDTQCVASQNKAMRAGFAYKLVEQIKEMKFDVVVGNPPYEKNRYKMFTTMCLNLLIDGGHMAFITPVSFMSGTSSSKYRQQLTDHGTLNRIDILPAGSFKSVKKDGKMRDMLLSTCVMYFGPTDDSVVKLTRKYATAEMFEWSQEFTNGCELLMTYDQIGRSIWDKSQQYQRKFTVGSVVDVRQLDVSAIGPNVNMGEKNELTYVGGSLKLASVTGKKIMTGKDIDIDGNCNKLTDHLSKSTNKRFVWQTPNPINLGKWMDSKLIGILMTMTGVQSNNTNTNLGRMPFIDLPGSFDTIEEFNTAVYDELRLTEEERAWVAAFSKVDHLT